MSTSLTCIDNEGFLEYSEGSNSMKNDEGRIMTKRVAVSEETHVRIRDFSKGLDTTMDEALNFLMDLASDLDDPTQAGESLIMKLAEIKMAKKAKKKDKPE